MDIKKIQPGGGFVKSTATFISIFSAMVSIIFYITSLDKRISLIENNQPDIEKRLDALREDVNTINGYQDTEINQFHTDVYVQINQMNDRIEKIYDILLYTKKKETI